MGEQWFVPQKSQPDVVQKFLEAGEGLWKISTSFDRRELPQTWKDLAFLV